MWLSVGAATLLDRADVCAIHSTYVHAVNLSIDERLLHLSPEPPTGAGLHCPFGVEITSAAFASCTQRLGAVGSILRWDREHRVFVDCDGAPLLALPGRLLDHPSSTRQPTGRTVTREAVDTLRRAAAGGHRSSGFGDDWATLLHNTELLAAARGVMTGGDPAAVGWLLGRGMGLTPSGDDVLVGLLAMCQATGQADPNTVLELRTLLDRDGHYLTTDISVEYLHHALRGDFAGPLLNLIGTLTACRPDVARIIRATADLISQGHSSGADTLLGVLLAATHHTVHA